MGAMETRKCGGLSPILIYPIRNEFLSLYTKYRPDAWVFKKIPSSSDTTTRFEDSVVVVGKLGLNSISRGDTRDSGTDYDYVEMGACKGGCLTIDGGHDVDVVGLSPEF